MRDDMFKVIVERPRRGGHGSNKKGRWEQEDRMDTRRASYDPDYYDEPANRGKIKPFWFHANRKELNENLEPLWRFLHSRVGQCWDDVYSEIRESLSPKNAVQMRVVQHLKIRVVEATYLGEDGRVYKCPQYNSCRYNCKPDCLEEPTGYQRFYVHPVTREFCESPRKSRKEKKTKEKDRFKLTDLRQYRLLDGIWYVVEFAVIPKELGVKDRYSNHGKQYGAHSWAAESPLNYSQVVDFLFPNGLSNWVRESEYGFCNIRPVSKRQLGKRELKHIKTLLAAA